MKTRINKFIFLIIFTAVIFSFINMTSNSVIAQSYFSDGVEVPVFEGTIIPNVTTKFDYWDLGEVNTQNNRLDLVVGVSQKGYNGGSGNYIIGNSYVNQFNDNFNTEVENDRFISLSDYSNPITGLIFAKLHSGTNDKKDIIISRANGDLEVYWNTDGNIAFEKGFKANGKVAAVGNFTSGDNLEDVAVIMNDTVKIYKNLGNGYLDSIPVYKLANVHASAVVLAQISSFIEPYATVNNTTSDKDEIILRQGDSIRIYLNNNSNGTSLSTILYTGAAYSIHKDFKISDLNHDGYNDIVIVEEDYGINVYRNINGTISTIPVYRNVNESFFHTFTVAVGDFDKNGWNDIIVNLDIKMYLYLNNKGDSLFSQNSSETYYYDFPVRTSCNPLKSIVADVYNKGGLAVLFSNFGNVQDLTDNDPLNEIEQIARINASDTDAVPAPAYIFESNVQENDSIYHPQLLLFNRGDRDFMKYRIYKRNYVSYLYNLFDSTESDHYIDTTEDLLYMEVDPEDPIPDNLFYYAVAVDNSYKVSVTSDTISYPAYVCPTCEGAIGPDNFAVSNERNIVPKEYSVSNYPNPFNPSTKIKYTLPKEGIVKITIYNSLGQRVTELVNEFKQPGAYIAEFNARIAEQGVNLSSGIYFYQLEANGIVLTGRMLLIK